MNVNIAGTSRHIARDLKERQPKLIRKATVTAMNRTNGKVFTEAKREIRAKTGIPLKHYKTQMKKYPAKYKALRARVWMGFGKSLSLAKVNTGKKINKKWTKLIDKKTLEGKSIANAFKAKAKNGHTGIFVRKAKAANQPGRDKKGQLKKNRLPLSQIMLDISEQATMAIHNAGNRHAQAAFEKNLRYEIQRRQKNIGKQ